ncbi:MAG: AI-2E family transporter [Proteobacteria bacterium]|nr:AI-2E family transporter [Pseudomonadota bacterium]
MTATLRWQLLALVLLVGGALWLLAPVLTPFAIAAMFAYLFDPVVERMRGLRMSRGVATGIVFLALTVLLILVLLWLIPYLQRQVSTLIRHLPDWIAWLQTGAVPWLNERFDLELELPDVQQLAAVLQQHWKEAGGFAATVLAQVSKSGFALVTWSVHVLIVPVAFFYLLRDWRGMITHVHDLLPRSIEPVVVRLAREADETLGGFLRGQLSVMIVLGVMYAIGLFAIGIDVGPLIGIIAGLISFVPYLGAITGVLMGVIAALVQYHDWLHVVGVLIVFGVGHLIEGYVLVPRMVGEKIGLHPLAVIFAVLAGGELFGFLGVLLALPVASVAMVVLRYAHERYRASELYGSGRAPTIVVASARPEGDPPPGP